MQDASDKRLGRQDAGRKIGTPPARGMCGDIPTTDWLGSCILQGYSSTMQASRPSSARRHGGRKELKQLRLLEQTKTHNDVYYVGPKEKEQFIQFLYKRLQALQAAKETKHDARRQALELFAYNLEKAFYSFESDFFQQNLSRIVDDVISQIKGSMELWPTLVEICYFHKNRKALPQSRVKNQKRD
jgi:hypothetical protein